MLSKNAGTKMLCVSLAVAGLIAAACAPPKGEDSKLSAATTGGESPVERGKYLVTQVGMCQDCHTPRLQTGEFDQEKWLKGSPLAFEATVPMPAWAPLAPRIAGLPNGWREADMVSFLQTGMRPDGTTPKPPMPEFSFNEADARAAAAYLASLKSAAPE